MIDTIYQLLKTIINKELRGNITPAEFNLIAKQVQNQIFKGYFEDANRDKNKDNRGLANKNYANLPFNQRQWIDQFSAFAVLVPQSFPPSGQTFAQFTLPTNLYLLKDRGLSFGANTIDEVESADFLALNSSSAAPSTTFPVYERYSTTIRVSPVAVTAVDCRYLRLPADPKWTYSIVGTTELYNPAETDAQDFELHEAEFANITIQMLSYFGVNIREGDIAKYAEALKRVVEAKE
tara:strand:+ start:40049 stop:40756 length:708 start_codon:yes stop_codon:yes gene_type:complete